MEEILATTPAQKIDFPLLYDAILKNPDEAIKGMGQHTAAGLLNLVSRYLTAK